MTIRLRTAFFIFLGVFSLWFLYIERAILAPFILAAIFAYIFNPIVNFLTHKIKLPRSLSVIIIYMILMSIVLSCSFILTSRILDESSELHHYLVNLGGSTKTEVSKLPDWIQPIAKETFVSLEKSKFFTPIALISFFPQAISRIVSFLIFLFSSFYLLKEGRSIFDKVLLFIPNDYKIDVDVLFRKINAVLGDYLRGQIFLIFIVSVMLFIALSILGIRFALIVAIFSGFAEIIPIIGPIVAATVASLVVFLTGTSNFYTTPFVGVTIVIIIYFVIRHFQDYFITPYVMGRITRLHPFIIFFAVIAGGHIGGILGLILAVPIAAITKLLLEYSFEKINSSSPKLSN